MNFIIFRAPNQQGQFKLAYAQTKILAGVKVTFHKHKYFSSEDLNLRNPTKFSLHFSHFSIFFYTFSKISAKINKKNKNYP